MLALKLARTSASDNSPLLRVTRSSTVRTIPGVQKPHCKSVVVPKGLLHSVQLVLAQTLDGSDFRAVALHREHQA